MRRFTVNHNTRYSYQKPVRFGEHRLMFRPRDSHDIRLVGTHLSISPPAKVRWYHDVFGNSIAIASFDTMADNLHFESRIVVDHYGSETTEFPIERFARRLPVAYPPEEIPDLGRTIERHYPDPERVLDVWARKFLSKIAPTRTHDLLVRINATIQEEFEYVVRHEPGVQSPVETLSLRSGSCRDLAVLMMEAARSFGFAARFVTGYLYDPALDGGTETLVGGGSTHAWVEVYLAGAGWIEFDPTNGRVGGAHLIRVGVARMPSQAMPVQGTFIGDAADFLGLDVEVTVRAEFQPEVTAAAD